MTSDYYDPHPQFWLEQSLVLTGHPGSGAAHVAHTLAARTGLPFTEVERWSEAAEGRSRARVAVEDGSEALRTLDAGSVERALARQPRGFISLGSGCLEDAATRARVVESSCLVFLRRPVEVLFRRITDQLEKAPGQIVEFLAGPPASPEALADWLRGRAAVEASAHAFIEGGDRHASRVADEILASLSRLTGVTRAGSGGPG
ncbi:MAG: shikimate kinase [Myxococcota bacterium]